VAPSASAMVTSTLCFRSARTAALFWLFAACTRRRSSAALRLTAAARTLSPYTARRCAIPRIDPSPIVDRRRLDAGQQIDLPRAVSEPLHRHAHLVEHRQ